ncbi:MAG: hypothetical protein WC052_06110 [Patescibacteria group bacterium]|jgi:hypothetical protein
MKKYDIRHAINATFVVLLVTTGNSAVADSAKLPANSKSHNQSAASSKPAVMRGTPLWRGSKVGMSIAQVKALFPNAHAPTSEPDKIADWKEGLLVLDDIELVNNKFKATFFFDKKKKLSVVFVDLDESVIDYLALTIFNSLYDVLRLKYGHEFTNEESNNYDMFDKTVTWVSGRTHIKLFTNKEVVRVIYDERLANEADKL